MSRGSEPATDQAGISVSRCVRAASTLVLALGLCTLLPAAPPRAAQEPADGAQPAPLQAAPEPPDPPWEQIAPPSHPSWPRPRVGVHWFQDLEQAFAAAREQDRPLLVLLRCPSLGGGKALPARVQKGEGLLADLLPFFITVELETIQGLDLARFPAFGYQDLDLPWWFWLLSPQGQVYSVYGGQEQADVSSKVSLEQLAGALDRVVNHHYDPRRPGWNIDGPILPEGEPPTRVFDLPGWPSWAKQYLDAGNSDCLRCHQVAQVERQPAIDARALDRQRDLNVWPLLENVGLKVEPTNGLIVKAVTPGRPAARAGIQPGDVLACAGGRRLFEHTDLRGVLHRGPRGAGEIEIWWLRGDAVHHGTLVLPEGWRKTRLEWRPSIARGNVGADCGIDWLERVDPKDRARRNLPADGMALRPRWHEGRPPTYVQAAGLTGAQFLVAVNGERPDIDGPTFQFAFRMRFDPGDPVRLTVRSDRGQEQVLSFLARHRSR
jgi:hypothetical protein